MPWPWQREDDDTVEDDSIGQGDDPLPEPEGDVEDEA